MKNKILILLCFLSSSLFGGVSGEIYTTGYHDYIVDTLNAVSGLAASNNDVLIKIASTVAILILSIKVLFNQSARTLAAFEIAKTGSVILIIQALFINAPDDDNHAYAVIDTISLQTSEVRQIPKGIGEFLALFTNLENGIMEKMELYFTTPNSLSYRQAGLGFTVNTQMEIMKSNIADKYLKDTFRQYIKTCKIDGDLLSESQQLKEILSGEGDQIISKLATNLNTLTVVYTSTDTAGSVYTCKEAWEHIKNELNTEALNHTTAYANARGLIASTYASKVALANMITGSTTSTTSAKEQLEQAIARNATLDSIKKVAKFNGIDENLLAKELSISELSMTNASILQNYQAQSTLPVLKALCMAFIIAITWLVGILAIATLNFAYVKFVIILNVWLMLWSPLFQVLNYAIDIMVSKALSLYPSGISAANQIGVYEILDGKLAMITNLIWVVPVLAFAIAGANAYGMVNFIQGMTAPVQQAAHHTAKSDLQSAMSGNESYVTSDGVHGQFGAATPNQRTTGAGGQTTRMNSDGNNISYLGGSGVTTATSSVSPGTSVSIDKHGNIDTQSSQTSASTVSATQQAMKNAESKVEDYTASVTKNNSHAMQEVSQVGKDNTISAEDGTRVGISESSAHTLNKMSSAANKEAMNVSSKDGLIQSVMNDKASKTAIGVSADASKSVVGEALKRIGGFSGAINANGSVTLTGKDGTTFTLESGSTFAKEYSSNFQESFSNQVSQSKENSMAFAEGVSAYKKENQSDSNSTVRSMQDAYSEKESAMKTYESAVSKGSTQSNNALTGAFRNLFDNSEQWQGASNEDKANFATNQLVRFGQGVEGINEMNQFLDDWGTSQKVENTVNAKESVESKSKDLKNDVGNLKDTSYNESAYDNTKNDIREIGNDLNGVAVQHKGLNSEVQGKVKTPEQIENNVNKAEERANQVIGSNQKVNEEKKNESVLINAASAVDGVSDAVKDGYKALAGEEVVINPVTQRYAENNSKINESTYKDSKIGDNSLIKHGMFSDDIKPGAIKDADTETLARIYNYDKVENDLSKESKDLLKDELKNRGYDLNNNEYSSVYEGEQIKADSIIPNGDKHNPASSIREPKNDFKNDFDVPKY